MFTANKPKIIIAAIAARAYVRAAVEAGYEVIAIDCFADFDTKRLAKKVYQVSMHNGGLDTNELIKLIRGIDTQGLLGLCYGAGFEMQSMLLSEINQVIAVIGNAEEVVRVCKDPVLFFAICDSLEIMHPELMFDLPEPGGSWLQKAVGGSGGGHIKPADHCDALKEGIYYQRQQVGQSIGCLFIANAEDVQMIGFHEQWSDDNATELYRYGGAVMKAKISALAKTRFTDYIEKLTQAIGLVGLNSCDAIVDSDDVYVLEVNQIGRAHV